MKTFSLRNLGIAHRRSDLDHFHHILEPDCSSGMTRCCLLEWKTSSSCWQWRRQDLLRGGAKPEIMSWGTHGGLQGPGAAAARW